MEGCAIRVWAGGLKPSLACACELFALTGHPPHHYLAYVGVAKGFKGSAAGVYLCSAYVYSCALGHRAIRWLKLHALHGCVDGRAELWAF